MPDALQIPDLTPEQVAAVQDLAKRKGVSFQDALSMALAIADFVVQTESNKGERLLVAKGSSVEEVHLR